jgi:hypothetical protein
MSTRAVRVCIYPAIGALAVFMTTAVADAAPANVQCYPTLLGPLCLDLTEFPWATTSMNGDECFVIPPQQPPPHCTNPTIPLDAAVPTQLPNGEWSAPVPVRELPPPLSGGQWPAPLPKEQWPHSGAGDQGSSPIRVSQGPVLPSGGPTRPSLPKSPTLVIPDFTSG